MLEFISIKANDDSVHSLIRDEEVCAIPEDPKGNLVLMTATDQGRKGFLVVWSNKHVGGSTDAKPRFGTQWIIGVRLNIQVGEEAAR
jgi:hypothetical protein